MKKKVLNMMCLLVSVVIIVGCSTHDVVIKVETLSGEGIHSADVSIMNQLDNTASYSLNTDINGTASFYRVKKGRYDLRVTCNGYDQHHGFFRLTDDHSETVILKSTN